MSEKKNPFLNEKVLTSENDEQYFDENQVGFPDDENFGQHDDPDAEGDDISDPKLEPSEEKASSTKFYTICVALESVWKAGVDNKKWSDVQKLWKILPPKYLQWLETPLDDNCQRPESIFPILRLLLPEKDGSRQFQMGENTIGIMYASTLGLSNQSLKYKMLLHYTDPSIVPTKAKGLGDFSTVVQTVVASMKVNERNDSGYTVGQINDALDMLASLPGKARHMKSNHDWKNEKSPKISDTNKLPTLKDMRVQWLRRLNEGTGQRSGLSALEHKWLVRILLKKMQFGVGWKKLLQWYNPYAAMLWSAHNSLKGICSTICNPEFSKARDLIDTKNLMDNVDNEHGNVGLSSYLPQSLVAPQFGVVFSPMLSERTGFSRILDDISRRHREYIRSDSARHHSPNVPKDCLAFLHPSFCVEPKLDGERFLVHYSREGIVKMHTRRGNWYSELYSPVLGPWFRRAVRSGLDVILDGEVIAWDSVREETVPFGSNRTIAKLRKDWMASKGMLDPRDLGMHDGDLKNRSISSSNSWLEHSSKDVGVECWLQFVAFDVLFVDGPDAAALLSATISNHVVPFPAPGSIIHLEAAERKKLLYQLIDPQPHHVEIIKTWIIRSNGEKDAGEVYFHPKHPSTECGYVAQTLDSLGYTLSGSIKDIAEIDVLRRHNRSDEQISESRALALQNLYDFMVDEQRMEGLIFKDLSSPYYLGEESKSTRYWHKFKPDYFNGSAASDLDLIVIGAYYASGLRNSGKPSSLLCACVDSDDTERFFPLCKVSLGSIDLAQSSDLLRATGFQVNTGEDIADDVDHILWEKGNWIEKYFPEYITTRSFQSNHESKGWCAQKKDYPDLWIHPNDSVIVTLNAGEIVASDAFSPGITLRFPRITKFRLGADSKPASEIESEASLREKYWDVQRSRTNATDAVVPNLGSPDTKRSGKSSRFLTECQYQDTLKRRNVMSRKLTQTKAIRIPDACNVGVVLQGISFAVLGSTGYSLTRGSIESDEALEHGWLDIGHEFLGSDSLIRFIKKHGGRYKISADHDCKFVLGGNINDPKVLAYIRAIENARLQSATFPLKTSSRKRQELANIAHSEGVIRWTFVVSLVYRWLSAGHTEQESILKIDSGFLQPSILDYLVSPRISAKCDFSVGKLFETKISTKSKMRRALDFFQTSQSVVCKDQNRIYRTENWRIQSVSKLKESERWIGFCKVQMLWPYVKDKPTNPQIIVYPDMVGYPTLLCNSSKYGESTHQTASCLSSVFPLLRIMGADVTNHVHHGITHVLCDFSIPDDEAFLDATTDANLFSEPHRVLKILSQFREVWENNCGMTHVTLISPQWVRKRKWDSLS